MPGIVEERALDFVLDCRCAACNAQFSVRFSPEKRDWRKEVTVLYCAACGHDHEGEKAVYKCVRSMVDLCPCGYEQCPNNHEWMQMDWHEPGILACVEFPAEMVQLLRALRAQAGAIRAHSIKVEFQRVALSE